MKNSISRAIGGGVDRARARAAARLDHDRVGRRLLAGQARSAATAARASAAGDGSRTCRTCARAIVGGRDERGQPVAGGGERLDVEVGQRDDGADVVLGDELLEERDVAGVVDARRRDGEVGGVARGRERVGIGGDRERVLGERADDVVALADAGEQDRGALAAIAALSHRRPARGTARACRRAGRGAASPATAPRRAARCRGSRRRRSAR